MFPIWKNTKLFILIMLCLPNIGYLRAFALLSVFKGNLPEEE